MNYLIFGDIHISQSSLKECEIILQEIVELCNKYSITHIISLGDNFDNNKPSASELNCLGKFISKLENRKIILLAAQSHESETLELSSVDIYGILSDNVTVVKEFKDNNHLFCGHFMIKESNKNYGAIFSKEDLKQYTYCFLGHLHSYQMIKPNICHLGSARYVSFDEAQDKHKIVVLITDYGTQAEKVHFLKLNSPIPMREFILKSNNNNNLQEKNPKNSPKEALQGTILGKNPNEGKDTNNQNKSISQAQNPSNPSQIEALCQQLDKLPGNTKVKVKIGDFESFKAFLPFESKYKEKFEKFVRENDFELISDKPLKGAKSEIDLKQSFAEFAKEKEIDEEIKDIIYKEIK
jgi:DNA repair exonuclease SbcCD nuclease subunit